MPYKFTKVSGGGSSVEIVQTTGRSEKAVMSQKATSQTFANALKGSESGNVVALKDVSPIEHSLDVKVSSKNLIPYPYSAWYDVGDITFVGNEDGTVTVNGASSSVHYYVGITNDSATYPNSFCIDAGTYTLSTGLDSGGSETVRIMYRDPETKVWISSVDAYTSTSFTIDRTVEVYRVLLVVEQDKTYTDFVFKPMLEKGITATNYTPYITDDTEITIKSLGKNVLTPISGYDSFVFYGNPFTTAGITYTLLEDGRIHLQGTVTGFSMCYLFGTYVPFGDFLIDGATYSISANIEGNTGSAFQLIGTIIDKTTGSAASYIGSSNPKFTVDKSKYTYDMFRIQTTNVGDVVDAVVGVQFEIGDTATEYEPYKEYETIITTVGEGAEFKSVAPNMTITTDNEGAIIECSYNKDTNKVIEKLTQAIISLGGNI